MVYSNEAKKRSNTHKLYRMQHVFVFVYRGALIDASFNVDFYLNRTWLSTLDKEKTGVSM